MASPSPIHLVFAQDRTYNIPFRVTLSSLLEKKRSPHPIHCWIITHEADTRFQDEIEAVHQECDVEFHWIEPHPEHVPDLPRITRQSFYYQTLFLSLILPPHVEKALFLDSDLLVMEDITPLWETELDSYPLAAVQDMYIPTLGSRNGVKRHQNYGLCPDQPYFNAGVMLLNLALWRDGSIQKDVEAYLQQEDQNQTHHLQEAYNAVVPEWKKLNLRWNVIAGVAGRSFFPARSLDPSAYHHAVTNPGILHFAGQLKPWRINTGSLFQGAYDAQRERLPIDTSDASTSIPNHLRGFYDRRLRTFCYPIERCLWHLI